MTHQSDMDVSQRLEFCRAGGREMSLTMKDVMTANCQIPNVEMLTSNHCAALARELNKLLADALAAQRDEGLAREAELREAFEVAKGMLQGRVKQCADLQQRLAEAEKLLRESRKHCDWNRHPLPQAIDAFLTGPGCADGEKAE